MNNTAQQEQLTLHVFGQHAFWGVRREFFLYDENFAHAANGNLENVAPPMMPKPRTPKPAPQQPESADNVVRLVRK